MNFFSLRALWRGLRGKSLTFSLVFAMAVMGFSFAATLRDSFRWVGLWGPLIWIGPILLTGWLAKNESKLKLNDTFRRVCAYGLIFGSILLAVLLWKYEDYLESKMTPPELLFDPPPERDSTKKFGPRGKRG